MNIECKTIRVSFDCCHGLREEEFCAGFSGNVKSVHAAINGFRHKFCNGEHPLKEIGVNILKDFELQGPMVKGKVRLRLRDGSGTFDDPYEGEVDVLLIAVLA